MSLCVCLYLSPQKNGNNFLHIWSLYHFRTILKIQWKAAHSFPIILQTERQNNSEVNTTHAVSGGNTMRFTHLSYVFLNIPNYRGRYFRNRPAETATQHHLMKQHKRRNGFWFNFNPLRAKFFRENINIYSHFMSFLHINKTQVVEIPPWVRQGPAYST